MIHVSNLNPEIIAKFAQKLGLEFVWDHELLTRSNHPPLEGGSKPSGFGEGSKIYQSSLPSHQILSIKPLPDSLRSPTLPQGEGDKSFALQANAGPQGEGDSSLTKFTPLNLLDYIYAVLHSPNYREKYKEFLKIDFPRVPFPQDQNSFWQLVELGSKLRKTHLLEGKESENLITSYPIDGNNCVEKVVFESGKVRINDQQFFDGVPEAIWEFFIGGYQPAQKWLKDRKDQILGFEEILHYQKIIAAINENICLMKKIDSL